MGGGSYSYLQSASRSVKYAAQTREEVFTARTMNPEMDIKDKIRESRDSEEHPTSFPIIIALDVTGSMGRIPENLIKGAFPEMMKRIMDAGIAHPQVCFCGVGDHYTDRAPIQVGQFESSDELLDKWLKMLYLEGGGGGNGGESYHLAWYFASRHTVTDSWLKREKKGILITIGDEPIHGSVSKRALENLFGQTDVETSDIASSKILKQAQRMWDVFHINVMDWSGMQPQTIASVTKYLGSRAINTENTEGEDVGDIISKIVVSTYNSGKATQSSDAVKQDIPVEQVPQGTTTHLR